MLGVFEGKNNFGGNAAAIFFLFLHIASFGTFVDATTYVYCSEIFPTHLRARGSSIAISGLFFATIIFTDAAPTAFAKIGWKYYIVFIVLTVINIGLVMKFWPETKGLSLDEINLLFGEKVAYNIDAMNEAEREQFHRKVMEETRDMSYGGEIEKDF
ncbi:hypothetical protein V1511DRAFT_247917 [Dipodascopsis uninucleata]